MVRIFLCGTHEICMVPWKYLKRNYYLDKFTITVVIWYTVCIKTFKEENFTLRLENGYSQENFCGSMLVDVAILPNDKAITQGRFVIEWQIMKTVKDFPSNVLPHSYWYTDLVGHVQYRLTNLNFPLFGQGNPSIK